MNLAETSTLPASMSRKAYVLQTRKPQSTVRCSNRGRFRECSARLRADFDCYLRIGIAKGGE